ncbi:class I adenylate-forming enzyme family protein [Nocardia sp. NPDC056100]|uniref:class I adenylate-forming enzyme family protein n=1 Tax=Nocardia sp. NPDC056100 TaxID=3345712 RepID=UPI0035E0D5CB
MSIEESAATRVAGELIAAGQPFEIVEEVVRGRRMRVWRNAPRALADLLTNSLAWGELDYLVHGEQRWTYAAHARAAASVARYLVDELAVGPGNRIAIAASNRIEWSIAFWGAASAGAIVVPLNSWGAGEELDYAIRDSGATVLFADAARLARLAGRLAGIDVITLDGPGLAPGASSVRELAAAIDLDAEFSLPAIELDTDDDATIFYTSGTTGRPKGAIGTHRNMTTNVMNLLYWGAAAARLSDASDSTAAQQESTQQSVLVTVPLFHATGCHATLVAAAAQGSKLVLLNKFDAAVAVDLIERERLTRIMGVPTTIQAIVAAGAGRDLSSITYVGYGGAPSSPSLPAAIRRAMPNATLGVGYGLTESSANATTNIGDSYEANPTSVGRPCPVVEVGIVDEDGQSVAPGIIGEVVLSGPNIVRGYWKRPIDSAAAFVNGALRTGDLGYVDELGNLYITDRSKDIVIRGGENVYCAEIEHILADDPQITEAAVIGRPHPRLGEEVLAIVRLAAPFTPQTFDERAARARIGERLAAFKVPSTIAVHGEPLPRTITGKLRKDLLRQHYTSAAASTDHEVSSR